MLLLPHRARAGVGHFGLIGVDVIVAIGVSVRIAQAGIGHFGFIGVDVSGKVGGVYDLALEPVGVYFRQSLTIVPGNPPPTTKPTFVPHCYRVVDYVAKIGMRVGGVARCDMPVDVADGGTRLNAPKP